MRMSLYAFVAVLATVCHVTRADELGSPIDLSSFSDMDSVLDESAKISDADETQIVPVDYGGHAAWIRPYVTGIVGASFGTINAGGTNKFGPTVSLQNTGSVNETMLNGGGAIGMAIARPSGLVRMEVEGRARGPMNGQTEWGISSGTTVGSAVPLDVTVTNGWSAMTNFWRDYFVSDRFGVYGGGGFGVGGYQYSMQSAKEIALSGSSSVNTFAWQVGTGVTYQFSDRITFDTGYRFFAMAPGTTPLSLSSSGFFSPDLGSYTSAFSASELLLSVRIYEPFRNWR